MMKRYVQAVIVGAFGIIVVANGCEINPLNPPDTIKTITTGSGSSISSGGSGGMTGSGGSAGAGGNNSCTCTDDGNDCTNDVVGQCPDGNSAACHTPKQLGDACTLGDGGMGTCDAAAICVDCRTCTDAACTDRCNGVVCASDAVCKTNYCREATCCDDDCAGPCNACNRPGMEGKCTRFPLGLQVPGCDGDQICNNNATCMMRTKFALGALCSDGAECQSGFCRAQYCRSGVGEPCIEDLECNTNLCDPTTKTCKSCTGPGMCPAGTACFIQTGRCEVLLGQPSPIDSECAQGQVYSFMCGLNAGLSCNEHAECKSHNCLANGTCSAFCDGFTPCVAGTTCSPSKQCGLPSGAYCVVSDHCESGVCQGFPRRCQ